MTEQTETVDGSNEQQTTEEVIDEVFNGHTVRMWANDVEIESGCQVKYKYRNPGVVTVVEDVDKILNEDSYNEEHVSKRVVVEYDDGTEEVYLNDDGEMFEPPSNSYANKYKKTGFKIRVERTITIHDYEGLDYDLYADLEVIEGVGSKTAEMLRSKGLETVRDVISHIYLSHLGNLENSMPELSNRVDDDIVDLEKEYKICNRHRNNVRYESDDVIDCTIQTEIIEGELEFTELPEYEYSEELLRLKKLFAQNGYESEVTQNGESYTMEATELGSSGSVTVNRQADFDEEYYTVSSEETKRFKSFADLFLVVSDEL